MRFFPPFWGTESHLRLNSDSESAPTEWAQQKSLHLRWICAKRKADDSLMFQEFQVEVWERNKNLQIVGTRICKNFANTNVSEKIFENNLLRDGEVTLSKVTFNKGNLRLSFNAQNFDTSLHLPPGSVGSEVVKCFAQ